MAKKITDSNPALELISNANEETEQAQVTHNTDYTQYTYKTQKKMKSGGTAKKDYRLNLLIPRELRETLQTLADFDRKSLNALINDVLASYAKGREKDCKAYTDFLKQTAQQREGGRNAAETDSK